MAALAAMVTVCCGTRSDFKAEARGGQAMISSAQAFEGAHEAITGKQYHDVPCDIAIERNGALYTVTFSTPEGLGGASRPKPTRVIVDAMSGAVRDVRDASHPEGNPRLAGMISGKRALEAAVAAVKEYGVTYDERWTTTVRMVGDKYQVTFPVPEEERVASRRSPYAHQVWVDLRTGKVVGGRASS